MWFTSTRDTKIFHPKLVPVSVPTPITSFPGQRIAGFTCGEVTENSKRRAFSVRSEKITSTRTNLLKVTGKDKIFYIYIPIYSACIFCSIISFFKHIIWHIHLHLIYYYLFSSLKSRDCRNFCSRLRFKFTSKPPNSSNKSTPIRRR